MILTGWLLLWPLGDAGLGGGYDGTGILVGGSVGQFWMGSW